MRCRGCVKEMFRGLWRPSNRSILNSQLVAGGEPALIPVIQESRGARVRSSCTCSNELPIPTTGHFSLDRLTLLLLFASSPRLKACWLRAAIRSFLQTSAPRLEERTKQTNERTGRRSADTSAGRMQITAQRDATRPYGGPPLSARSRPTERSTSANRRSWRPLKTLMCSSAPPLERRVETQRVRGTFRWYRKAIRSDAAEGNWVMEILSSRCHGKWILNRIRSGFIGLREEG